MEAPWVRCCQCPPPQREAVKWRDKCICAAHRYSRVSEERRIFSICSKTTSVSKANLKGRYSRSRDSWEALEPSARQGKRIIFNTFRCSKPFSEVNIPGFSKIAPWQKKRERTFDRSHWWLSERGIDCDSAKSDLRGGSCGAFARVGWFTASICLFFYHFHLSRRVPIPIGFSWQRIVSMSM